MSVVSRCCVGNMLFVCRWFVGNIAMVYYKKSVMSGACECRLFVNSMAVYMV